MDGGFSHEQVTTLPPKRNLVGEVEILPLPDVEEIVEPLEERFFVSEGVARSLEDSFGDKKRNNAAVWRDSVQKAREALGKDNPETEEEWVIIAHETWTHFLPVTKAYIRNNFTKNEEDLEDILQEAYIGYYSYLKRGKNVRTGEPILWDKSSALLLTVATRRGQDYFRKEYHKGDYRVWQMADLRDRNEDLEENLQGGNAGHIPDVESPSWSTHEALASLKNNEHRQVILLRYYVGLGVDEISRLLGRSYKSTESLLSRARRAFEHEMTLHGYFR